MKNRKVSRREFIEDVGLLLGGAAFGSMALTNGCTGTTNTTTTTTTPNSQIPGVIYSPDTLRNNRLPPGQDEVSTWPQLQSDGIPDINPNTWTFTISGRVDKVATLNYGEFISLPAAKVFSDIHCVTTWTRLGNLWEGYGAQTIAGLVTLKPDAKYVIVHASGGFTSNLPLSDFLQTDVLFPPKHDDAPLTAGHGAPVRLVVPRLYFWKSAKWVTGIEFTAEDHPGFWESQGYNNHGDPWKEERYS
jgi:DMSO/TMAO reductase YedYZ molybdopterin-dependent catalytic subunit